MSFLGGLFEKKYCSICGEKIAFLGNRKLSDGNMCKSCCNKLSPRFSDRKESTVAQIKEQLAYREQNKQRLLSFTPGWTYGQGYEKLYVDTGMKAIVITDESLTSGNPDIINLSDITGVSCKVDADKTEVRYKSADGRTCSYIPAQYITEYDFYVTVTVRHPYFSEVEFKVNDSSVKIQPLFTVVSDPNQGAAAGATLVCPKVNSVAVDPSINPDYRRYLTMAEDIVKALLQYKEDAAKPAAVKSAVKCPHCGASTVPDDTGRCEFCQGAIN